MTAHHRSLAARSPHPRALLLSVLWIGVVGLLGISGCTFEWPPLTTAVDGSSDAGPADAEVPTDADLDCDAATIECGACGRTCGDNATCELGVCVCAADFLDCDDDPHTNGCEQPRAYSSDDFGYYSTLEDQVAAETPVVGPGATVVGAVTYPSGIIGNGMSIVPGAGANGLEIPNTSVLRAAEGAIRFWYRPTYAHDALLAAQLIRCEDASSRFDFLHTDTGYLYFLIEGPNISHTATATVNDYLWYPDEWVEIELQWTAGASMQILVNGDPVASETDTQLGTDFTAAGTISVGHLAEGREANGVIDELMFFRTSSYELVGGPCEGTLP